MFTGLIEARGTIAAVAGPGGGAAARPSDARPRRITVATELGRAPAQQEGAPMRLGDSVAVDGCCLTVVAFDAHHLSFEAATETLARTTLGRLQPGDAVNLERALRFGDRLGGHLVAGHIDGVGQLQARTQRGSALYFDIAAPPDIVRLTAPRGSITVAGVSLTVTDAADATFSVGLIPHTLAHTTLGTLQPGAHVNLEADLLARYVERLLSTQGAAGLTPPHDAPMPWAPRPMET